MPAAGSPATKSQERIYSSQQLVQALRSGLAAVKDQLGVLSILDGTAASWPGVNQAIDDMDFLIDMSAQTTSKLESEVTKSEAKVIDSRSEVATLRETLSLANQKCEDLALDSARTATDNRQVKSVCQWVNPSSHHRMQSWCTSACDN
jgi:hypothetical protein